MAQEVTDFGKIADDLHRASFAFASMTSSATAFGASLQVFRNFQTELTMTAAIANATAQEMGAMADAAREFALVTTASASDAVMALQSLAQAGFNTSEAIAGMSGVLLLSLATMTDVSVAADTLSSTIRAFGLAAADMTRVSNVFVAAMNTSLASMDKLTYSMRQVAPVANVANLSLEQTVAWLDQLYNVGLRGEQAGTALRNVIVRLARPTGDAAKILRQLGISTVDATGNMRDLEDILTELSDANLSEASLAKIFENEALAGAIALMKAAKEQAGGATSAYQENLQQITGTTSALEVALKNMSTFDSAMKLLQNALVDLGITVGEQIAPAVQYVAEAIGSLLEWFRELAPEAQQSIATVAGALLGLVATFASINAAILLFRATGVASMFALTTTTAGGATSLTLLGTAVTAVGAAFTALRTILLTQVIPAVGAALVAMNAFLPGLPLALGIAAITTAIFVGVDAWNAYSDAAEEAARSAEDFQLGGDSYAKRIADHIGTDAELQNISARFQLASDLVRSGLAQMQSASDPLAGVQNAQRGLDLFNADAGALRDDLWETGQDAQLRALLQAREQRLQQLYEIIEGREQNTGLIAAFRLYKGDDAQAAYEEIQRILANEDLTAEQLGMLQRYEEERGKRAELLRQQEEGVKQNNQAILDALTRYLTELSIGARQWEGALAGYADTLNAGIENNEEIAKVAEALASLAAQGVTITPELVAQKILELDGSSTPEEIAALVQQFGREKVIKQWESISGALDAVAQDTLDYQTAAKEERLRITKSLAEAVALALDIGNADLEAELTKIAGNNDKKFDNFLNTALSGLTDVLKEAGTNMSDFLAGAAMEADVDPAAIENADIVDVLTGKTLIDAIQARIDENTTPEQARAIAAEEKAKWEAIVAILVENIKSALNLPPAVAADLEKMGQVLMGNIDAAIAAGISGTERKIEQAETSVNSRNRRGANEEGARLKAAKKALKEAREAQDLLRDAQSIMLSSWESYVNALGGLGLNERIELNLQIDTQKIEREFDDKITKLRRKMEDVKLEGNLTPELEKQYEAALAALERTKQAELDAANSFTAAMARRSAAIKLFIRDLENAAATSKNTFDKIGAGIAVAFAQYQEDLVTLTDISSNAITDMMDAVSSGVADFIFDNGNAWENFKKSMLSISREIFEGFTKAFMQQALSSLTGGGGSIFGNALQPSQYGSTGTPSVGTGGILGGLMSRLGIGGQQTGAGGTAALQATLQSTAAQTQTLYQTHLAQMQAVFTTFTTQLQATLSQVVANIGASGAGASGGGLFGAVASVGTGSFAGAATNAAGAVNTMTSAMTSAAGSIGKASSSLAQGILETAQAIGANPIDLAKAISFETGGTFNPLIKGPTTKWGQHRGLIQFGEGLQSKYGIDFSSYESAMATQLGANGAIARYMQEHGFQPGMSGLDLYSTINAGRPGRYGASDTAAGGTWGTVADKWNSQMEGHLQNAQQLFGDFNSDLSQTTAKTADIASQFTDQFGNVTTGLTNSATGQPGQQTAATQVAQAVTGQGGTGNPQDLLAQSQQLNGVMMQFVSAITQTLNQFGTQFAQALNQALMQMGAKGGGVSFAGVSGGATGGGGGGLGLLGLIGGLFGFAEGGKVRGPGTTTSDSILALLSDKEFVVNAQAAEDFGPLLHAINTGMISKEDPQAMMALLGGLPYSTRKALPAYASGGYVNESGNFDPYRAFVAPSYMEAMGASGGPNLQATRFLSPQQGNNAAGKTFTLNNTYNIGNAGGGDNFRRSAVQHAKVLARQLERAQRYV
ncbi:tape measure protein [Rhodobacter phage RcDurkin]|nr:tape measure protein [Rhodobacter phage RcDurkin]QXN72514.1 tape measure protein [Rhodobacter phage RcTiptonus]UUV44415.1 tape measure protein [Rhodobacter phage RcMenchie]